MQSHSHYLLRLDSLISSLKTAQINAFLQPINDRFQGEYIPECDQRLPYISGFTGSAGAALFLDTPYEGKDAILFVDGRYTIQAAQEVDESRYLIINTADMSIGDWLAKHGDAYSVIGYDAWLHTHQQVEGLKRKIPDGVIFKAIENPIDAVWQDQPELPEEAVERYPEEYAGESAASKCKRIAEIIKEHKADAAMLTLPDGINWLLNIRGNDIPYNPLFLCYALIDAKGGVTIYAHASDRLEGLVESVTYKPISALEEEAFEGIQTILCDPAVSAEWFFSKFAALDIKIKQVADPTLLPKAIKNEIEIEHIKHVHCSDGRAVSQFLNWLRQEARIRDVTEMEAAQMLEQCRKEVASDTYRGPSFTTISGAGPNGAIVHYRVTEKTDRPIGNNELYLVDSGGQYWGGTTDVTRTMSRGTPTEEMIDRYTRVLKGHIAIDRAQFPQGTTGSQLDPLARQYLWEIGCDYQHGTGHGVGAYLCVHEGPQRISKVSSGIALKPGMVLSNEPGYYKAGEYGIRIENLVLVVEKGVADDGTKILGFETLTLAPMEHKLIDETMLTDAEKQWLESYEAKVAKNNENM